jgi:hypothetical protein
MKARAMTALKFRAISRSTKFDSRKSDRQTRKLEKNRLWGMNLDQWSKGEKPEKKMHMKLTCIGVQWTRARNW